MAGKVRAASIHTSTMAKPVQAASQRDHHKTADKILERESIHFFSVHSRPSQTARMAVKAMPNSPAAMGGHATPNRLVPAPPHV